MLTGEDFAGALIQSETSPDVRFRLEHQLGVGATATAYYAMRQTPLGDSPAVVKIISPGVVTANEAMASTLLRKEAVALGRLSERLPPTPFVVRVMEVGAVPYQSACGRLQLPWLALEYVHGGREGARLADRVAFSIQHTGFAFDVRRAARLAQHVCAGLAEVHGVGVIHRDITPSNVLACGVGEGEVFKLSDFGIARPAGMAATLGPGVFGTPGYIAPEQALDPRNASERADIFAFGCILFFALTGEHLFPGKNPYDTIQQVLAPERRSLRTARALAPELLADDRALRALDQGIAQATAPEPAHRPQHARALLASLSEGLRVHEGGPPSRRHIESLEATRFGQIRLSQLSSDVAWIVRRPPTQQSWVIHSVSWDGDGNALAVTSRGLLFWDGSDWLPAPVTGLPPGTTIRCVRRVAPGRWIIGGTPGTMAEYARDGITRILRHSDPNLQFLDASGELGDLAVAVAERTGSPPLLCGLAAGYWLKPLALPRALSVSSLARLDDERWLVVGRGEDGRGLAAVFSPLARELEPLGAPPCRAFVASASLPHRSTAVAAGGQGAVMVVAPEGVEGTAIAGRPDLASVAIDLIGQLWVGGSGQLWTCPGRSGTFTRVWHHPEWQVPFVSILADLGRMVAVTADGGVLECRTPLPRTTAPPPPPPLTGPSA